MRRTVALAAAMTLVGESQGASADGGLLHDVLPKLAASSAHFEADLAKASFTVEGYIESVDRDGHGDDRREGAFRVTKVGKRRHYEVIRYTEDGENKIDDARKKAEESSSKDPDPDDEAHMPFLASEQPKYAFRLLETDKADPGRVRIQFVPKQPDKHLVVGSAWVDTRTGDVLTMGASPSKRSLFVDYFRITLEFGAKLGEGSQVSRMTFEGSSGLLFFHKRFRGVARFFDYRVP
ncbi:MAG TPA: hypothetical protein VHC01_12605 [Gaiellaceae bacterium]|nr:hypothetical protein [Gaiellaceae bacterium]